MARIWFSNETADVTGYLKAYIGTRRPASVALFGSVTLIPTAASAGVQTQITATSGGTALKWITKPMAANVTIAGKALMNIWAKENNADANVGLQLICAEYTTSEQAAFLTDVVESAELTTSIARTNWVTTAPSSTVIEAGNRLVVYLNAIALDTTGTARTVTFDFDGITEGTDGDSYIEFQEAMRTNERQAGPGNYPTATGFGQGFYQNIIDGLNAAAGAGVISLTNSVQVMIDDLGFERDNL